MTELSVVRSEREAARLRHPAGKGREPRFICVVCSGPMFECDCVDSLLDGYETSDEKMRRYAREAVDEYLDEMAEQAMAVLKS